MSWSSWFCWQIMLEIKWLYLYYSINYRLMFQLSFNTQLCSDSVESPNATINPSLLEKLCEHTKNYMSCLCVYIKINIKPLQPSHCLQLMKRFKGRHRHFYSEECSRKIKDIWTHLLTKKTLNGEHKTVSCWIRGKSSVFLLLASSVTTVPQSDLSSLRLTGMIIKNWFIAFSR